MIIYTFIYSPTFLRGFLVYTVFVLGRHYRCSGSARFKWHIATPASRIRIRRMG